MIPSRRATTPAFHLRSGLTLLDLTATVLIIGIVAAVASRRLADSLQYHQARSAARRVAADLKLARRHAKFIGADETVSFDVPNDRYTLSSVANPDHASQPYAVELGRAPFRATIDSADFGGASAVTFNGFGLPDNGGAVVVQAGGSQTTVFLDPDSGSATVP